MITDVPEWCGDNSYVEMFKLNDYRLVNKFNKQGYNNLYILDSNNDVVKHMYFNGY